MQLKFAAAGAVAIACGGCAGGLDTFPIGGAWHMRLHSSGIAIEAGPRQSDIYRDWQGGKVLVASDIEFHEYYETADCLLWETRARDHAVYAACGDRAPILVATDDYHRWTRAARGLVDESDVRVDADGAPVRPTVMYALDDIIAASMRQQAFSAAWRVGLARRDDALAPIERDEPVAVDAVDDRGRTALMDAAITHDVPRGSRLALVNALIERGANLRAADKFGVTALMLAADRGNTDVVRRLIEAGADIHARSHDGRTALMEAAGSLENQVEMVTMLLDAGADKQARDKYGRTAFSGIRTNTDPQLKVLLALQ